MARTPPTPVFVHFGLKGGVTSCAFDEQLDNLYVGTAHGVVVCFDMRTHLQKFVVHEDREQRSIQTVGVIGDRLWVHVRNFAILVYKRADLVKETVLVFEYVGFCKSLAVDGFLMYATTEKEKQMMKACQVETQKTQNIDLDTEAFPMCATFNGDDVFIAVETGDVVVVSRVDDGFKLKTKLKVHDDPIFSIASSSKYFAVGLSVSPIKMYTTRDFKPPSEIHYPPSSASCTALAFSPSAKQLLAGFTDGSLRVFSTLRLSILLVLSHHSASISDVVWRRAADSDDDVIAVGSSDEKLSIWNFR